jgi:hypothetical protein
VVLVVFLVLHRLEVVPPDRADHRLSGGKLLVASTKIDLHGASNRSRATGHQRAEQAMCSRLKAARSEAGAGGGRTRTRDRIWRCTHARVDPIRGGGRLPSSANFFSDLSMINFVF